MTGGNIDASGGTGIIAANTASLKGGQISVSNDGLNDGLGVDIVSGTAIIVS